MCIKLLMVCCFLQATFPDNKPLAVRNHFSNTLYWKSGVLERIPGGHSRSGTNTRPDHCFCTKLSLGQFICQWTVPLPLW